MKTGAYPHLMLLILLMGILTASAAGQASSSDAPSAPPLPLHLQVPPRDASHEVTMRWILCPGNYWELQDPLLEGYLATLPADQFPPAFEALCRLQMRQKSLQRTLLIEAWAKKDPQAAWLLIKDWFAQAVDSDHFKDDWSQKILPPANRTSLRAGSIVHDERDFEAFRKGLFQSGATTELKNTLQKEYAQAYAKAFHLDSPPDYSALTTPAPSSATTEPTPPPPEIDYPFVRQVLEAPATSFPALLDGAVTRRNEAAVICGLRRWVMVQPGAISEIIKWAEAQPQPNHLDKVVNTWAAIAPKGAYTWLVSLPGEKRPDHVSEFLPYANIEQREAILRWLITRPEHKPGDYDEALPSFLERWIVLEPKVAFEFALQHGGRSGFSEAARDAFYRVATLAEFRQPIIEAIEAFPTLVDDQMDYMNMEEWGDINFAEAARHGVHWLIKEAATNPDAQFPIDHVVKVWTGKENPVDGSMDDRTYGCLRLWAVVDPEGMKAWIKTVTHPEFRTALEWLHAHAEGGFEAGS
ncbi:hypothetical protein [Roseimicrobium sp. ORNL1]|uniref:hypothetical protein n=1 Tax=Roseimicrobium sp. ORNL1 TaxID=2711231 RepID=UPI0013E123E4|nr:hypothetical protein [Roseimicrobium sp. ORNL1]QIF00481.1 hypothetical protein G5S37_02735 [Roseimicrobium sp. ORNL1]